MKAITLESVNKVRVREVSQPRLLNPTDTGPPFTDLNSVSIPRITVNRGQAPSCRFWPWLGARVFLSGCNESY